MQRPPAAVVVTRAVAQDVPIYIEQIGKTSAINSVVIQPQVDGTITEVHFKDGSDVKKGQLLFTIDPRPFEAALAQAQATRQENQAKLKYAQDEFKRVEDIRQTGAVSIQEFETKRNAVAVAEAQVASAEAAVQKAQLDLEYCQIKSPIDGRAGARMVDPGNVVTGGGPDGGTKLLRIEAFDPIYADFTITENELGTVRKFMAQGVLPVGDPQGKLKVFVDIPGDAQEIVSALGGMATAAATTRPAEVPTAKTQAASGAATTRPAAGPREGVLTFLDNAVQQGSGTVRVRATVPNKDKYFWPGQFVRVRLVLTVKQDAVLVPLAAQQIGQQGPYVYVVSQGTVKDPATGKETPGTIATLRPIVPGQRQEDMLVVEQGVHAGEQVVIQGHLNVMPGGPVMVMSPQQGGGGAAAPGGATAAAGPAPSNGVAKQTAGEGSEKKS
jgi:multidrug efflux system membrane fusion protein